LQNTSIRTGNLDICYYNYLCKIPAFNIEDFGHVYSNIAYIVCGLMFILICIVKRNRYT
jgi:hypothetical protein